MGRLTALAGWSSLTRLRVAFVALGLLLLAPLGLLMASANQRLEEQRRLRHEVVGERIFDELERELTNLLQRETQRPSSAYDQYTTPQAWAPFIVGYFTASREGTRCVAEEQLDEGRRKELERVLPIWLQAYRAQPSATGNAEPSDLEGGQGEEDRSALQRAMEVAAAKQEPLPAEAAGAKPPASAKKTQRSSPEVLNQLNRARESRAKPSSAKRTDPMQDYSVGF